MKHWNVYALRYGEHKERLGRDSLLRPSDLHDVPMPMDYFIWVLQSGARTVVADTGFEPGTGARRGRRLIRPIADALKGLGIDPGSVGEVIITHLHYDHAGNLNLFPNARFHLQEREIAFATGRHMTHECLRYPFDVEDVVRLVRAVYAERVVFHQGDAEIGEGLSLHLVGGHSDGLQMVRAMTARGPVVLASDASHYYANISQKNPFPIYFELGSMAEGWRRAKDLAGGEDTRVIPGHDPRVRELYPAVEGSGGETVMLHVAPRAN